MVLSVGVFIDLRWRAAAGGHVKCWERFAQGAIGLEQQLDLTLYFLGDSEAEMTLAKNVRYRFLPPRLGTERLPFLRDVADQTDLAAFNPALYQQLEQHDVLHTTHQLFTFGKTALRFAVQHHKPLVASIHTDVPKYTEIYTRQVLGKLIGAGWLYRFLTEVMQVPQQRRRAMEQQLRRYWPNCQHVWASQPEDGRRVAQVIGSERVSYLPRGIDKEQFHPRWRDRQKLLQLYGIDPDVPLVLFVGRLNPCKSVMVLAQALRRLLARSIPVQGLFVGQGPNQADIQTMLGDAAIFTGLIAYTDLPLLYASADLFVLPSQTETYGNVVVEAKSCSLPVVVSNQGGAAQLVQVEGQDGIRVSGSNPVDWAETIAALLQNPTWRAQIGQAARRHIETTWPSWKEVLTHDLLPIWQAVAQPSLSDVLNY